MTSRVDHGISSAVSALFMVVIIFAAFVPTLLVTQSLYSLLSNEVNSRRYFETDRFSERLEVVVTQLGAVPVLKVVNKGPISVTVVRVWAYDVSTGATLPPDGPCVVGPTTLNPGSETLMGVGPCVQGFTGYVMFEVVTERGREFTSDIVSLRQGKLSSSAYPYTLTVSIIGMRRGRTYMVEVEPLGTGEVSPRRFTHKATASNENVTVAFGTTADTFRVTLYENGRLVALGDLNPQNVTVPDYTAVIFDLGRETINSVALEVIIMAPPRVVVGGNPNQQPVTVQADVYVRIPGNAQERVVITQLPDDLLRVTGGGNLGGCVVLGGITLTPGQPYQIGTCSVIVMSGNDITLTVPEGTIIGEGENSGLQYTNAEGTFTIRVSGRPDK